MAHVHKVHYAPLCPCDLREFNVQCAVRSFETRAASLSECDVAARCHACTTCMPLLVPC